MSLCKVWGASAFWGVLFCFTRCARATRGYSMPRKVCRSTQSDSASLVRTTSTCAALVGMLLPMSVRHHCLRQSVKARAYHRWWKYYFRAQLIQLLLSRCKQSRGTLKASQTHRTLKTLTPVSLRPAEQLAPISAQISVLPNPSVKTQ